MTKNIRKCIACNEQKNVEDLIKITFNKTRNEIRVMPDSHFFGRSSYICYNRECVENAFKKGKLFKTLRTKPDENLKEKIRTVLDS